MHATLSGEFLTVDWVGGAEWIRTGDTDCLTFQDGLLTVYKVAREFESISLRQRVPSLRVLCRNQRDKPAPAASF